MHNYVLRLWVETAEEARPPGSETTVVAAPVGGNAKVHAHAGDADPAYDE